MAKLLRALLRRGIRRVVDDSSVIGVVVTGPYYLIILVGIMMLLYKPFEQGDSVTVPGYSGEVEEVNLRHTTLRRDGERCLISNSTLLSSPLKLVRRQERTS